MNIEQQSKSNKQEQCELHQQDKEIQRLHIKRKHQFKKISIWSVSIILILGLSYWMIIAMKNAEKNRPGEFFASQGQKHIANGAKHPPYNSNPPTSGWHYATPARAGFYDKPIADETLIHNLEHGYVIISYNCKIDAKKLDQNDDDKSCKQLKEQLKSIVQKYRSWKIIAVPRVANDSLIALTAWTRLQKLESFNENAIDLFIKTYRNKGPENTSQ